MVATPQGTSHPPPTRRCRRQERSTRPHEHTLAHVSSHAPRPARPSGVPLAGGLAPDAARQSGLPARDGAHLWRHRSVAFRPRSRLSALPSGACRVCVARPCAQLRQEPVQRAGAALARPGPGDQRQGPVAHAAAARAARVPSRTARGPPGRPHHPHTSPRVAARDPATGAGMSAQQLRDEVMTLLFAGHETTALALTRTWYLLARHPEVGERLRCDVAAVLAGRVPTVVDLPHLPYIRMVLEEALRPYPPAWVIARAARAEAVIGGYPIPAGTTGV